MGKLVKLLGTGIGLAAEAIHARKERSRSPSTNSNTASSAAGTSGDAPPAYSERYVEVPDDRADDLIASGQAVLADEKPGESMTVDAADLEAENDSLNKHDEDDAYWALDEAADSLDESDRSDAQENGRGAEKKYTMGAQPTVEWLAQKALSYCPPPPSPPSRLPYPVILPQRRPGGKKDRGFVRAYAPVLDDSGIPQEAFLTFLKTLYTANSASPILNVVFVGAGIVGMAPSVAAMITSTVVQVAVGIAMEIQKRTRSNSFLDEMNERLFRPRGLYALVMVFKPDEERSMGSERVDVNHVINKRFANGESKMKESMRKMKLASGKTYGEIELPEAAPLVFPAIDEALESGNTEKANKWKSSQKFVAAYMDKRAQASYVSILPRESR